MKKSKKLIYSLLTIFFIAVIASFFLEIKLMITITSALFLLVLYIYYKEKVGQELIIALFFAFIVTSYYLYEYNTANLFIGKINLFPLSAWTAGLVILREIYEKLKLKQKFIFISLFYILGLFILEFLGYYIFKIQLNSDFPSILRLGVIHAPLGMKFFYIFAGPLYILVTDYLRVK